MIGLLKDYISMAARNVRRGKSRSFLTSLAIAIGIAAVVLLTAIGESGKTLIYAQLENIGINGIMVFPAKAAAYPFKTVNASMPGLPKWRPVCRLKPA